MKGESTIIRKIIVTGVLTTVFALPLFSFASHNTKTEEKDFEIGAWIPYWRVVEGTEDAMKNLDTLTMVNPFSYGVNYDGSLNDLAKLETNGAWEDLEDKADDEDVSFIPTIMWNDGQNIHRILSDRNLRENHIETIDRMVTKNRYDGVVIDYEAKLSDTRESFSEFLEELKDELGSKKELICAVEARTPPESLYRAIPPNLEYANDYKEIGEHCDKVILMTYDQTRADWQLNGIKSGSPYIPIADSDWVKKVAELAMKDIPKEKIILGVPTYGFEYEVTVSPNWFQSYRKLWSISDPYAKSVAAMMKIEPFRNKAGELSFSYAGSGTPAAVSTYSAPANTAPGDVLAQKALAYANATGKTITFNLEWWSDAEAIMDKVDLAKELDLAGVALFRIDANEDPEIWDSLQ